MPQGVNPSDLIIAAFDLIDSSRRQANLRRAISTAYYAMFHALAKCCANVMVGGPGANRRQEAWRRAYRALEHGLIRKACQDTKLMAGFPRQVQDFAENFVTMQSRRHLADYDPGERFYMSDVRLQIGIAQEVIAGFEAAPLADRRAFAAAVLFRARQ